MFATSCLTLPITSLRSRLACLCECESEHTHLPACTSLCVYMGVSVCEHQGAQGCYTLHCGCNEACMSLVCVQCCVFRVLLEHRRTIQEPQIQDTCQGCLLPSAQHQREAVCSVDTKVYFQLSCYTTCSIVCVFLFHKWQILSFFVSQLDKQMNLTTELNYTTGHTTKISQMRIALLLFTILKLKA